MKNEDPAIDEVRELRHRISESVEHDPRKFVVRKQGEWVVEKTEVKAIS